MSYIDLHTHILPGLDDGSPDMRTTLEMISGLVKLGFSTICATPHQKTGQYLPSLDSIKEAHKQTVAEVAQRDWPITIPLAAENMWDSTLYQRIEDNEIPGYELGPWCGTPVNSTEGAKHLRSAKQGALNTGANSFGTSFLVEFIPNQLPIGLFERLFALRCKKLLPVIAHPERYTPLWKNSELQEKLAADCAMVVDLGALSGHHGRKQAKQARKMVLSGIAHAAASDVHSPNDLKGIAAGIEWIRNKAGTDALQRLLATNPAKILEGVHPDG